MPLSFSAVVTSVERKDAVQHVQCRTAGPAVIVPSGDVLEPLTENICKNLDIAHAKKHSKSRKPLTCARKLEFSVALPASETSLARRRLE